MRIRHVLPNFRIAVVGAGAIGLYYGGKLAHYGRDVHFLVRSDFDTVRKRGLRIRSKSENIHVAKVHASQSSSEIGQCDLVLVAVKTTANEELPALVAPLLGKKTLVLTLQNGLGNEDFLARHFGGGTNSRRGLLHLSESDHSGLVEAADSGRLLIGEFRGYPRPVLHDIAWEFKRCRRRLPRGG